MGMNLSAFTKLFRKKPMKILMVGPRGAGKTTIIFKIKLNKIVTTIPTISYIVETIKHRYVSLNLWEIVSPTRKFRYYFPNTDAVIFVLDSTDGSKIEEAEEELRYVLYQTQAESKTSVLLVFANKQDLPDPMSTEELAEKLKLNSLRNWNWHIQATISGTSGAGLYEGLDWLFETI